jgi:glutaredoxin
VPRITLYSKPGCTLCDRVREILVRCRQQVPFELEYVDITQQPALMARYGQDIPVILLDGQEIARHFLREQQVLELLRRKHP